jgi:phage regulator Rha-like protein
MLFSQKKVPRIGVNLVDNFQKLQHKIELFANDFQEYLDTKKQELDNDAKRWQDKLNELQPILDGYVLRSRFDLVL